MKKILTILLFLSFSFSYDLKKADFSTFCNYVSFHIGKNIVISEEVKTNFSVFMPNDDMKPSEIRRAFFTILKSKNLNYKIIDNTILVYKKTQLKLPTYVIRFNYIPSSVISTYIKNFYPGVKFQIFQNKLLITCNYSQYHDIKLSISKLQNSYKKAQVNFLITVINNKKAKELGSNLSVKSPFHNSVFFDLVTDTATISSSLPYDFSTFIRFLNQKGVAETISKPTINLIDSHDYSLESVHNIPYTEKTVTVDKDGNPVTQTDIKYKDIGLKIYIKNVYITEKNIDFDMDIYIQNIVSMVNNNPITDTKHFNTHIQLTKDNPNYIIAGLRSVTKLSDKTKIPVLGDIPVIGLLFQSKKESVEDLSFSFYISTSFFKNAMPKPEERP